MAYTVQENKNTNTNEERTAIPAGDYTVKLEHAVINKDAKDFRTGGTQEVIQLRFRICEGQKYSNLCLFKTIYKNEQGEFNFSFLGNMLKSIGYGEGTTFDKIEDALNLLKDKEYIAYVKVDDKNPTRNYISYFKNNTVEFNVADDDLPF